MKRCKNGVRCVQADEFPGGLMPSTRFSEGVSRCKKCHSRFVQESKYRKLDVRKSLARKRAEAAQMAVINELAKLGIPAERFGLIDVRAWGCVHIEVKMSTPILRGGWKFTFKNTKGINGRIVCLVPCCNEGIPIRYCVFPANFPAFFNGGNLKRSVQVIADPKNRKSGRNPLAIEDLNSHENNWELIEQIRLLVSREIVNGINNNGRVTNPEV